MFATFRFVPAALALFVAPAAAEAASPVNAFLSVNFSRHSYLSDTPGSYTNWSDGVNETVNWGVRPAPFLEATVEDRGNMKANLSYWFDIAGPTDIGEIPLYLTGRMAVQVDNAPSNYGVGIAWAQVGIYDQSDKQIGYDSVYAQGTAGPNANPAAVKGFALPFTMQPNTTGRIQLSATALVRQGMEFMPLSRAYAMIDPVISIDPAFAAANPGVKLRIDPTIGNAGAVPEPASWAMLIVGFGAIGGTMRRRRRVAALI